MLKLSLYFVRLLCLMRKPAGWFDVVWWRVFSSLAEPPCFSWEMTERSMDKERVERKGVYPISTEKALLKRWLEWSGSFVVVVVSSLFLCCLSWLFATKTQSNASSPAIFHSPSQINSHNRTQLLRVFVLLKCVLRTFRVVHSIIFCKQQPIDITHKGAGSTKMSIIDSTVSELKVSKDISNVDSDSESDSSSTPLSIRKKQVAVVDDTEEPIEAVPEVDYETQRKRNILENQKLMLELGLNPMSVHRSFPVPESSSRDNETDEYIPRRSSGIAHMARQQKRRIVPVQPVATRSSKRIRGEPAKVYQVDIDALESGARGVISDDSEDDEDGEYGKRPSKVGTEPPPQPGTYARVMWKGRKQTNGFTILTDIPDAGCPMTLGKESAEQTDFVNLHSLVSFVLNVP